MTESAEECAARKNRERVEAADVIDALVEALEVMSKGIELSTWHDVDGEKMKRVLVAKTAIKRIDAALSLARGDS